MIKEEVVLCWNVYLDSLGECLLICGKIRLISLNNMKFRKDVMFNIVNDVVFMLKLWFLWGNNEYCVGYILKCNFIIYL